MEKLRELRKEKGMSMKALGEMVGVAESTISLYENEKRNPDPEMLKKFADIFNVSTDYLLGRTDNPSPIGEVAAAHFKDDKIFSDLTEEEQEAVRGVIAALRAKHKK